MLTEACAGTCMLVHCAAQRRRRVAAGARRRPRQQWASRLFVLRLFAGWHAAWAPKSTSQWLLPCPAGLCPGQHGSRLPQRPPPAGAVGSGGLPWPLPRRKTRLCKRREGRIMMPGASALRRGRLGSWVMTCAQKRCPTALRAKQVGRVADGLHACWRSVWSCMPAGAGRAG